MAYELADVVGIVGVAVDSAVSDYDYQPAFVGYKFCYTTDSSQPS